MAGCWPVDPFGNWPAPGYFDRDNSLAAIAGSGFIADGMSGASVLKY
jgi:hypothetical protein